ncbi:DUF3347 domain-containing protein [Haoranjiania flava]|uniref:DUF3347 domain-containing protein n=1 Tax=Haoranjiania flava TaxID=1856322 RepID=A0AAE3IQ63_9BACT|nr:DUF3347 domain-containing protein [Haoranjiania flava]MCU7694396.1 DUF3347 domain-containing protein [Haoranjiania flava]
MKHLFTGLIAASVLILSACNNNADKTKDNAETQHDMENRKDMEMDHNQTATPTKFGEVFAHYQHLTFALSNDDPQEAASGAKAIGEALAKVDKTGFTPEQQETFADLEADIKEHTEHIAANTKNMAHQREHLEMLSHDIYDIAKTFGAGKTMYKIFCPMYNDNKGAFWLNDSKEVKNPYFGSEMLTCGEIQEEIK